MNTTNEIPEISTLKNALNSGKTSVFRVNPRYSGGSPAVVSLGVALAVALDEVAGYQQAISGVYGDEMKAVAEREGLHNIVCADWERGRKVQRMDIITGECFEKPARLEHEDIAQAKILKRQHEIRPLSAAESNLLEGLLYRAKINRQEL